MTLTPVEKRALWMLLLLVLATWLHGGDLSDDSYKLAKHEADAAFVLYDLKADRTVRHNADRCAQPFSPHSTFKIPHTIIALETGVADSLEFFQKWDSEKYPRRQWMSDKLARNWLKDHTLESAFRNSVVWYYRELAPQIGEENMNRFLTDFDYGNRDISSDVDSFWLSGSLKISADDQVRFLRRFYQNELNISAETRDALKTMMLLRKTDKYRISGKTGSDLNGFGWLVGYVETSDNTWFFAFNAELPKGQTGPGQRLRIVQDILRELKVIE